jgi:hypothetical protein
MAFGRKNMNREISKKGKLVGERKKEKKRRRFKLKGCAKYKVAELKEKSTCEE